MDTTKELPTVIAFCAGYGGIERGLDLTGVEHRVIAYVEIEAFCIANLVAKMETGELPPAPIYTDLKTFPAHLFRDRVDLITGGYPCQPFSAAGKRLGEDDPRHLWPHIRKHIEAIRPARCFFENVEGHISLGLSTVISDLEDDGYLTTWGIFSAREVGAPHQRKRVYILADSNNGQRELKDQEIRARRDSAVDGCADLADTDNPRQQSGCGSIQEPEVRNYIGRGGKELADTRNLSNPWNNGTSIRYVKSKTQGQTTPAVNAVSPCSTLSDTISARLEGQPRHGKDCSQSRWIGEKEKRPVSKGSVRNGEPNLWPPEPGLGRVVDGCTDRVDRIRLLGNGVVPATAAKAWSVLSNRI